MKDKKHTKAATDSPARTTKPAAGGKPALRLADWFSVAFGLGLIRHAPGTFGSLPGIPLSWGLYRLCTWLAKVPGDGALLSGRAALICILILTVISVAATCCISTTEKAWGCHDDKSIVIDEVVGQMLALSWFPPSLPVSLAGFILFRFFDILKPGPISWVDRNTISPFGTLLDDLIAGAMAALILGLTRNLLS